MQTWVDDLILQLKRGNIKIDFDEAEKEETKEN